jgi:hypothetical protein
MKIVGQTENLVVVELDRPQGKELFKKIIRIDGEGFIPTHVLVYDDRMELRVERLFSRAGRYDGRKKTKQFSYSDLLVMNWALNRIGQPSRRGVRILKCRDHR